MPTAVHLQLRIVSDDGTVLTDNEIPHLEKSDERQRVARIHKIVRDGSQPKQHVSVRMTLRRNLSLAESIRTYRIWTLNASDSHVKLLIYFNYIRAIR
jgi:hypothetical protein